MKCVRVNDQKMDIVISRLLGKEVGFDIETDREDTFTAEVSVVQIYCEEIAYLFPFKVIDAFLSKESKEKFKELYKTLSLIGHNLNYDVGVLYRNWGLFPKKIVHDSYVLSLMRQCPNHGLKELAVQYVDNYDLPVTYEQVMVEDNEGHFIYSFENIQQVKYMAYDPYLAVELSKKLWGPDLDKAYQAELSLIIPLEESSSKGIRYNASAFPVMLESIQLEKERLQVEVDKEAGYPVKANSSAQVCKLLFEEKGLPIPPVTTKSGKPSVSEEALGFLEGYTLVDNIVALKGLISVESGVKKLPEYVREDGHIHPEYRPIGFDGTARIYTKPSINQVPKDGRACFIPDEGKKFVYADWKSAEMYIAAYLAQQENLLEVYNSGGDIHSWLASKVLGMENPTKEDREISKVCEFACVYGSEGPAVSRRLHVSDDKGRELVSKFLTYLDKIKALRDKVQAEASMTHRTSTILGRPRVLRNFDNPMEIEKAKRQSFNTRIQGSCADLQKVAIRKLYDLHDPRFEFKFTVFDSFLIEVDDSVTDEEICKVLDYMSDMSDLFPGLKLRYSYGVAYDWKTAQELA